ncbi:MAG: hypothetical protein DRO93_14755 [Candidatus Thorarchaeota archaeon]|nr:MAG: hypothetical protein DRO93_14755 [Candidatus Thorarchaeota archaeon]HDO75849.1 hypothetical protein [Candidatus Poribacteria bacterium]HEX29454.1 hypothetical protein [Candidatus Poribacteria bacterium]
MGNAFAALSDDPTALFWNPAGIVQIGEISVFGQMKLDRSDFRFDPKGIAYRWRRFGLGWGNKIAVGLEGTPDYNYYSAALKLSWRASVGISFKFKRRHPCRYYQFFGYRRSSDIGFLVFLDDSLSMAVVARGDDGWNELTVAWAYRGLRSILAFDLILRGFNIPSPHLGLELVLTPFLRVRGGFWIGDPDERRGLSAGIGLYMGILSLHYAWIKTSGEEAYYLSACLSH